MEEKDWIYELEDILKFSKNKFDSLSIAEDINIILDWVENDSQRLSYQIYQAYKMYKSKVKFDFMKNKHIDELIYELVSSYGDVLNQFSRLLSKNNSISLTDNQKNNMFNIINVLFAVRDDDLFMETA